MTERYGADESIGSTSSSLINKVKAQDQEAWRRLVRLYGPLVQYWLSQAGLQLADAHDVFQEVFASVAQGVGRFRKDRPGDSFRGWLRTVVRSKVNDHFRRQSGQPSAAGGSTALERLQKIPGLGSPTLEPGEPEGRSDSGEDEQLKRVRRQALEMIRAEFEERTWQAFWRVTVHGHSPREVAEDLGITPSAVRLAKSRVLRRLREELGDL